MLSDGHIARRSLTSNPSPPRPLRGADGQAVAHLHYRWATARFVFSQSGKKEKRLYFHLIFDLFKIFCNKDYNYYIKT
jgi:hypothetical protein